MRALKPIEFIQNTGNHDLDAYITYLTDIKCKLEEAIVEAKDMGLEQSVTDELEFQLREILDILSLLEKYLYKIVLSSIDNLSMEELQSYFEAERISREEEIKETRKKLNSIEIAISDMAQNIEDSRKKEAFYVELFKTEDVKEFFGFDTAEKFLEYLLDSDMLKNGIESDTAELITREIIESFGKVEPNLVEVLTKEAMSRLQKGQNLVNFSSNAKEVIIDKLLRSDELNPYVKIDNVSEQVSIIDGLMHLYRQRTSFFAGLDEKTQKELLDNDFSGEVYEELKSTYEMLENGLKLPSEKARKIQLEQKNALSEERASVNRKLEELIDSMHRFNAFLNDGDAMKARLKSQIIHAIDGDTSLQDVKTAIENYYARREALEASIQSKITEIGTTKLKIKEAQELLENDSIANYFQIANRRNTARLLKAFGVDYSAACVQPIIDAETKRLKQIEWMCSLQKELQTVEGKISNHYTNSNFLIRHTSRYKDTLNNLEAEYLSVIARKLNEARENDLLYIEIPRYTFQNEATSDSSNLPRVATVTIKTFDDVFSVEHTFWDFSTPFTHEKCEEIAKEALGKDWSYVTETLMPLQRMWLNKLWNYKKDERGHYIFELSDEEKEKLKFIERSIIALVEEIQKQQSYYSLDLNSAVSFYDNGACFYEKQKLGNLGITEESRDGIDKFIASSNKAIEECTLYLQGFRSLCEEFGIEIPENSEIEDISPDLNEPIKALNIPGVETVEEAKDYQVLLESLEYFTVSQDSVKNFYMSQVVKNSD